jgi:hypothetical protein
VFRRSADPNTLYLFAPISSLDASGRGTADSPAMTDTTDWRSESAWVADRPTYLRVVWGAPNDGPIYALDLAEALWNVELLYDFSLLLAHPKYQGVNLANPEEFFSSSWQRLDNQDRLLAVSVAHHSPLIFLALIPLVVGGAAAVRAITHTVEDAANIPVKWRTLRAKADNAEWDARRAEAEARRAEAEARRAEAEAWRTEAENAEYQRLLAAREAQNTSERIKEQVQAARLPMREAELLDDEPVP